MPTFSDVPEDHPYYDAIEWAAANGITIGYPDGTYQSDRAVSRGEMAVFLQRFDGAAPPPDPEPEPPPDPTGDIVIDAGDSIQSVVDANPAGTSYILGTGIHKDQQIVPKTGDSFIGQPGAILDGSGLPANRAYAFNAPVDNVTVEELEIRNFDHNTQQGVIRSNGSGNGWVVRNNNIHHNTAGPYAHTDWLVEGNHVHHNEQIGIFARGFRARIINNEISYNNYNDRYSMNWEAGGTKFLFTESLVAAGNNVHDNHGAGLWSDGRNYDTLYEDNTVTNNYGPGIEHEVSYDAIIRRNVVEGNAFPFYIGGILVSNSANVEVYENTLRDNDGGIVGIQDDRENQGIGGVNRGPLAITGLNVHDNDVAFTAGWSGVTRNGGHAITTSDVSFERNNYTFGSDSTPLQWVSGGVTVAQWKALGFDTTGTFN